MIQEHITTGWDNIDQQLLQRVREAKRTTETINIRGVEITCSGVWEQNEGEPFFNIDEINSPDQLGLVLERITLDQINEAIDERFS